MAYTIAADITFLGRGASLELTVDDLGQGQGELSFADGALDLKVVLGHIIKEIQNNDPSFESPFGSIDLPDLAFEDLQITSFDHKTQGSGMTLAGDGTLDGNAFTVKYGVYAKIGDTGLTPQSFSLLLQPFTIDHIPVVNVHLDKPITIDIQEVGIVTAPFYDESKKRVESGFYIRGYIEVEGVKSDLVYPGTGQVAPPPASTVPVTSRALSAATAAPIDAKVSPSSTGGISTGGVKWININRTLGPATLKQVGLQWKDGKVWLMINASVAFNGIELDILGLKAGEGIAFPPPIPVFGLDGLGLAFNNGGVDIAGEFLKSEITPSETAKGISDLYDGMLAVKFEEVFIGGIGSYANINGHKSIFAYAFLDYPLGGPSFFFVEGLALGFGYNRELISPPVNQVSTFPLVSQVMAGNTPANAGDPLAMLSELDQYVPPKEGDILLLAGIKFSTFQVLDSFLLLSVTFGDDLLFELLGLSILSLPPDENQEIIVFIELALKATVDPGKGLVQVEGLITKSSYVLAKAAHITGGFAFYSWFKDQADGAKAGDFVVTLGGYHPDFKKPDYYPAVPRFQLNWRVDEHMSIKADTYFAMTPRYAMAGFDMRAVFQDDSLAADFRAGANFIVQWKPFHYDLKAYVSLHIAFTASIDLLFKTVHKTFHLDVAANLHLWGPKFTGHADIHVRVMGVGFSFAVDFGAGSSPPPPLSWTAFQTAFLPADSTNGLQINVVDGLVKTVKRTGQKDAWVLNPHTLKLKVESVVPASTFSTSITQGDQTEPSPFAIGPMQKAEGAITSTLTFNLVEYGTQTAKNDDLQYAATPKQMPAALWGAYQAQPDINADSLVELVNGVLFSPANPPTPGSSSFVPVSALQYDTSLNTANHWSYDDGSGSVFSYDESLFTAYLPDFSADDFPQMTETTLEGIQEKESLRAAPLAVNLLAKN